MCKQLSRTSVWVCVYIMDRQQWQWLISMRLSSIQWIGCSLQYSIIFIFLSFCIKFSSNSIKKFPFFSSQIFYAICKVRVLHFFFFVSFSLIRLFLLLFLIIYRQKSSKREHIVNFLWILCFEPGLNLRFNGHY